VHPGSHQQHPPPETFARLSHLLDLLLANAPEGARANAAVEMARSLKPVEPGAEPGRLYAHSTEQRRLLRSLARATIPLKLARATIRLKQLRPPFQLSWRVSQHLLSLVRRQGCLAC
jgi:hypothetical protein